jgi:hypothetical protein
MSGEERRMGAPQGPPWSLDLLADLHAGVLDRETADDLSPRVLDDPEAREVLAALDATSTDLAGLPPLTIPDDVASRIDTALEDEVRAWSQAATPPVAPQGVTTGAEVVDLAKARRRRRRIGWGAGLLTAAAAVLGIVVIASTTLSTDGSNNQAASPPAPVRVPGSPVPLALQGGQVNLDRTQFTEVLKSDQYAHTLADPKKLVSCLQANGVTSGKPMGAREVTLDGRPAQLFILPGGTIGKFRLLTVGPDCGPGSPSTISDTTFGG